MSCYCDSSFFFRLLIASPNLDEAMRASAEVETRFDSIPIAAFTRLEVIQAIRFEAWLHTNNRNKGMPANHAEQALNLFHARLSAEFKAMTVDYSAAFADAERLTRSTPEKGWRTLDLIHVASALVSGAKSFYSYDQQQNLLATREGMETPLLGRNT